MLDTLSDMEVADKVMKASKICDTSGEALIDKRFKELNMEEITPLHHDSNEFKALGEYLISTSGATHFLKYDVKEIFRISRNGEHDRFEGAKALEGKVESSRKLLWHGSRTTNFGGILSQGLRIAPPEAPKNGYMFGKRSYLLSLDVRN